MKEDLINLMEFQSTPKLTEIHQCWVNFDVAVFEEIQKISDDAVVWDENGVFTGALRSLEDMDTDAEEAEVMAVMRGTEFAATVCPFAVIIEGGSLQRFQALNSAEPNLSKIEHLLDLVKQNGLLSGRSLSHMSVGLDASVI